MIIKHKFSTFFENVVSWCIFPNMQAEIFIPDKIVCCVRLESELYMVGSLVAEFPEMRLTLTWISSFYLVLTKDVPQHTATLQHKQGEGLGPWNSSKQQCVSMREDNTSTWGKMDQVDSGRVLATGLNLGYCSDLNQKHSWNSTTLCTV